MPHEISALPAQEDKDKVVRLHITPFTPALLKVYITPSVLPVAKNISYHTVETFPEKGFGFVELPAMEAQKLKKKLTSMESQQKAQRNKDQQHGILQEHRKKEKELIKQGKKPFFLKKCQFLNSFLLF